jgi:undecaprenyl-diphosphatase
MIYKLIFLGILQGLTEFLPVSSSGHLSLAEKILNFPRELFLPYNAFLHLGTTGALLFYFRKKILEIINNLFKTEEFRTKSIKSLIKITIGTIPIILVGFFMRSQIEDIFSFPVYIGFFLIVNGLILFLTKYARKHNKSVNYSVAFLVGLSQTIALIPGISRSGITISTALLLGLNTQESFEFSFLLSIPAVLGANILFLKEVRSHLLFVGIFNSLIITFICGLIALTVLRRIVITNKLYYFGYYSWFLGCFILAYYLVVR